MANKMIDYHKIDNLKSNLREILQLRELKRPSSDLIKENLQNLVLLWNIVFVILEINKFLNQSLFNSLFLISTAVKLLFYITTFTLFKSYKFTVTHYACDFAISYHIAQLDCKATNYNILLICFKILLTLSIITKRKPIVRNLSKRSYFLSSSFIIILANVLITQNNGYLDFSTCTLEILVVTLLIILLDFEDSLYFYCKDQNHENRKLFDFIYLLMNNMNCGLALCHEDEIKVMNDVLKDIIVRANQQQKPSINHQTSTLNFNVSILDRVFSTWGSDFQEGPHSKCSDSVICKLKSCLDRNSLSLKINEMMEKEKSLQIVKTNSNKNLYKESATSLGKEFSSSSYKKSSNTGEINQDLGIYKLNDSNRSFQIYKIIEIDNMSCLITQEVTKILEVENKRSEQKYRNIFLAKMAHEIKTPCIAISCLTSLIEGNEGNFLRDSIKIFALSELILNLISEIHLYINGFNQVDIHETDINIEEILKWSHSVLVTILECDNRKEAAISPILSISEKLGNGTVMKSDERKLKIILSQLMKNAIKFTTEGQIIIGLEESEEESYYNIFIKDTGCGMNARTIENILDMNKKKFDEDELFLKQGGLGIGLKIVNFLCSKLDIKLSIESREGEGTTAYLKVKLQRQFRKLNSTRNFYLKDLDKLSPSKPKLSTNLKLHRFSSRGVVLNHDQIDEDDEYQNSNLKNDSSQNRSRISQSRGSNTIHKDSNDNSSSIISFGITTQTLTLRKNKSCNFVKKRRQTNKELTLERSHPEKLKPIVEEQKKTVIKDNLIDNFSECDSDKSSRNSDDHKLSPERIKSLNMQILDRVRKEKKNLSYKNSTDLLNMKKQDTQFCNNKNTKGELGYNNTLLSNNSVFPFKSNISVIDTKSRKGNDFYLDASGPTSSHRTLKSVESTLQIFDSKFNSGNLVPKDKTPIEKRTSRVLMNFSNNQLTKDIIKDTQKSFFPKSKSKDKKEYSSSNSEINNADLPDKKTLKFNTPQESIPENVSEVNNTPENSKRNSKCLSNQFTRLKFLNTAKIQSDNFSIGSLGYTYNHKKKILVVDDDNFCRKVVCLDINKIIKELKLDSEVEVIQEDDGLGLIQRVLKEKTHGVNSIKLIISDENMNILNGSQAFNIVKTIEEKKKSHKIAKYILTAIEDDKNFDNIRNISGAEIIKKPAKRDILKELIQKVFQDLI